MSKQEVVAIVGGVLSLGIVAVALTSIASVGVGEKGVLTTFNKVDGPVLSAGYSLKAPWTNVHTFNIRQQKSDDYTMQNVYNVDSQNVTVDFQVIYNIPSSDNSLKDIFQNYNGDPFQSFALARIKAAVMSVTGKYTTTEIVKQHDKYKRDILAEAQKNVGDILVIDDVIIPNVTFDKEIEEAVKAKQVAALHAQTAQNKLAQAKIDAQTAVVSAQAEAKSKQLMSVALAKAPQVVELERIKAGQDYIPFGVKTVIIADPKVLLNQSDK